MVRGIEEPCAPGVIHSESPLEENLRLTGKYLDNADIAAKES